MSAVSPLLRGPRGPRRWSRASALGLGLHAAPPAPATSTRRRPGPREPALWDWGWPGPPSSVPVTALPPALGAQYLHVFLTEVTALVPLLSETKHSFALYTPERTRQRWPVHLAAATEQDMNDWVSGRWCPRARGPGAAGSGYPGLCLLPVPFPAVTSRLPTPAGPAQPVLLREPQGPRPPLPAGHLVRHLQGGRLRE